MSEPPPDPSHRRRPRSGALLLAALTLAAVAAAATGPGTPPATPAARSTTPAAPEVAAAVARSGAHIEARVAGLLALMTTAEKVGQLNLVSRGDPIDGQIERVRRGEIGMMLNVVEPGEVRAYQAAARQSRLAIPLVMGLDAITVFRIAMPLPLALAATWNPALVERTTLAVARETAAHGINWTFAPMVDLSRDPRWGRVSEGAGEDPHLAAAIAAARVRGYRAGGLATAVKHFVGYGAPEAGRDYNGAAIPTSELFDRYLPPFRAALDAGSETVMAAFNTVNGIPVTADRTLLTGLLRDRLGFRGFVTSDFNAIGELQNHGVAADLAQATRKAILAGVDVDMEGAAYERHLADEIAAGRVPMAVLDEAVRRVLRVKIGMGLLDRPQPHMPPPPPEDEVRAVAREAAVQSLVLLKNDRDTLPIAAGVRRVALVGAWAAGDYDLSWWGPAGLTRPATETLLAALRARLRPGQSLDYAPGYADTCGNAAGDPAEAVAKARAADLVVVALAFDCDIWGEAASRAELGLSPPQQALLAAVAATGTPVALLVSTSRPLVLTAAEPLVAAILVVWHGGTEGRTAIAEALVGDVAPSGKLPMSFPRSVGQLPFSYDALPTSRPPGEDRFTSRYVDMPTEPLYPFGHGLGYARFTYDALSPGASSLPTRDGRLAVTVDVTNQSPRSGDEVVQLYVRQRVATRSRPLRQLKAFEKIRLRPGERRTVTFHLTSADLGYHDDAGRLVIEPGPFELYAGGSSAATLVARFELVGDTVVAGR